MLLHESILDRLKSQHLAISKIIKDVDVDLLNKSPEPGKWSIRENLAHITGYHHVFLERLNKILND
ncbi:MAG: DinB family protein, partial [Ignavibacteria bacterium]